MAAYPSTVYRLDASGEVHEVVVEETDEELQVGRTQVTMSDGRAEEPFDEITWWSRQLGRRLSAGRAGEGFDETSWWSRQLGRPLSELTGD